MLLNTEQPVHRRAISLTPLIDVVFILLLFFMLSSTFMQWRQIDVSAPSETETEAKKQRVITLLSDVGDFKIDDTTLSIKSELALKQIVQQDQEAVYVIKVMPGLRTQSMINLLDAFKQAGANSVTLAGVN
ncbi:ExbD/TolR family protein [Methylophaga sp. OBS4]|uniref:ExbD/TolR family protein n=1 Tax=Methylophaga sp. OBS4 TaxID=2991935 RepID=UPI002256EB25|nr:biopolymer transporter ExbD [Methylophaga sp. OBS4]MCX4187566.1 biopolymer transporter ExbD [Methylophaga sp. OBS4]